MLPWRLQCYSALPTLLILLNSCVTSVKAWGDEDEDPAMDRCVVPVVKHGNVISTIDGVRVRAGNYIYSGSPARVVCDAGYDVVDGAGESVCLGWNRWLNNRPLGQCELAISAGVEYCGLVPVSDAENFNLSFVSWSEMPWMARLEIYFAGEMEPSWCSGSLLSGMWLITTAHCLSHPLGRSVARVMAYLGRTTFLVTREKFEIVIASEAAHIHPDFRKTGNDTYQYDVALIKLSQEIVFSPYQLNVRPICLPDETMCDENNPLAQSLTKIDGCSKVTSAGYFKTDSLTRGGSMLLREYASMVLNDNCRLMDGFANVSDGQLCVIADRKGVPDIGRYDCRRERGGPLFCSFERGKYNIAYLIGVDSYGKSDCGASMKLNVYSRVCRLLDWVKQVTAIIEVKSPDIDSALAADPQPPLPCPGGCRRYGQRCTATSDCIGRLLCNRNKTCSYSYRRALLSGGTDIDFPIRTAEVLAIYSLFLFIIFNFLLNN